MEQFQAASRPATVALFEVLGLGFSALPLVLGFDDLMIFDLIGSAVGAAFVLWITRGRSSTARTIYTILLVVGAALLVFQQLANIDLLGVVVGLAFNVLLLALVWSRPTTRWLDAKYSSA